MFKEIDNMSIERLRSTLKAYVDESYEVQSSWHRVADRSDVDNNAEQTLTVTQYFYTEIHFMIVDGLATRADIEACINDCPNQTPETAVVKLVELGTDLLIHRYQLPSADLDALHAQIQDALLKELKEDVLVKEDTCARMDELAKDVRYELLLVKLVEDQEKLRDRDWTEENKWIDRSAGKAGERSENRS
jgi:hypothetical protein